MRRMRSVPVISSFTSRPTRSKQGRNRQGFKDPSRLAVRRHRKQSSRSVEARMRRTMVGILAVVALVASGCASMDSGSMAKKPLYDRLGGKPAITAVVDDFVGNVAADARINRRFANADI